MESTFSQTLREAQELTNSRAETGMVEPSEWGRVLINVETTSGSTYGICKSVNLHGVAILEVNEQAQTLTPAWLPIRNITKVALVPQVEQTIQ